MISTRECELRRKIVRDGALEFDREPPKVSGVVELLRVKRRAKLTPDRRPILTPRSRDVASG